MKTRILKKVIGMVLSIAMLASVGTTVMAEDVGSEEFVSVAKYEETLPDGTILEKELQIAQPKTRAGFSGTRTGLVTHRYFAPDRSLRAMISATAVFNSTPGENVCYLAGKNYQTTNYLSGPIYKISNERETSMNNEGLGILNKYSKYEVSYYYNGNSVGVPTGGNIWIKCESDGGQSDSGNSDRSASSPVYKVGGSLISFG